jgi:formate hydrogenlyase transcriptional activator
MAMSTGLELIGSSIRFQSVLSQVHLVAPVDCAVLIQGETGTGKEVIARAIHEASERRRGPFVTVNCAAIPSALLESELFGHERGAFTGAIAATIGRFQAADRGTLFLDEIGDLPVELQPKLLRVLQERQFERLGSTRTIQTDVRILAASNRDLAQMVQQRQFRADLYYRLSVFPITLAPLRERREDIPLLVQHFVRRFAARMNKPIEQVPEEVMNVLKDHSWPGNIRELQNFVERAVILSTGRVLRPAFDDLKRVSPPQATSPRTLAEAERSYIVDVLRETKWVVGGRGGAAARLGVARTTLIYRMRKLGIAKDESRGCVPACCEAVA